MPVLDAFDGSAYNMQSLTAAIQEAVYIPQRLGEIGLFAPDPIRTTVAMIEFDGAKVSLIKSSQRGSQAPAQPKSKRRVVTIPVPHFQLTDQILAEDLQDLRAFGSETELESVDALVTKKLNRMRQSFEATEEYLRCGAIQGIVKDADDSVLCNLFTAFDLSEQTVNFDLNTDTSKILTHCMEVRDAIDDALDGIPYSGIRAVAGKNWFRKFIEHPQVKYAYQLFQDGSVLRSDNRKGFEFGDITFEEYRGKIGGKKFIPDDYVRFYPVGCPEEIFLTAYAPADTLAAANTLGQPYYAQQERMKYDKGIEILGQSNPMPICAIPECLVKGVISS